MEVEEAKRRSRKGPLLLLGRRASLLIITFLSATTVARLVSPQSFGLANMAMVILAFGQIFRDFGLTNAILRKGNISAAEISFVFWFNVVMTFSIAAVVAIAAPAASIFYHEDIVFWVILVSLIGFIFNGCALQHRALIMRDLRFGTLAMIDVLSAAIGFLVTLGLAYYRGDVWALVYGTLTQSMVTSFMYFKSSGWLPQKPKRPDNLRELISFGANTSVFSVSVFFSNNAAAVLIGHFLGAPVLGQYNRAQTLFQMPISNLAQPIAQATMPLLTRLRAYPEEYRNAYLQLVKRLCAFLIPLSVILFFSGVPLTKALLGSRWNLAGEVLAALAPALAGIGLAYAIADLFVTQNRSAELRTLGIIEMFLRVGAVFAGVSMGLVGAAIGFAVSTIIVALMRMVISGRTGPVTVRDQACAAFASVPFGIGAAIACASCTIFVKHFTANDAIIAVAIISSGALGGISCGLAFNGSREVIHEIIIMFGLNKLKFVIKRMHI